MSPSPIALLLAAGVIGAPTLAAASPDRCPHVEASGPGRVLAASRAEPIQLGRETRIVALDPACAADGRPVGLARRIAEAAPHRRLILVIEDLRAGVQPGVLFDLSLTAQPRRGERRSDHGGRIGQLNFYAAQKPGVAARPRKVSYDVTELVRALMRSRRLAALSLTIRPAGDPAPGSDAVIGRVVLLAQ